MGLGVDTNPFNSSDSFTNKPVSHNTQDCITWLIKDKQREVVDFSTDTCFFLFIFLYHAELVWFQGLLFAARQTMMTLIKCIFSLRYADYKSTSAHMDIIYHLAVFYIKGMAMTAAGVIVMFYTLDIYVSPCIILQVHFVNYCSSHFNKVIDFKW